MTLVKDDKDLSNWGILLIALIVVVSIFVGMAMNRRGRGMGMGYRRCPRYMKLSRRAREGFYPTPTWANYKALPALPIPDRTNCVRFLGTPPAPVAFPDSDNPYFPSTNWTVSFWVKFDSLMTTESFPLMRKGTISQNGTPSILFERRPYIDFAGMEGTEGPNNKPCLVFTYNIKDPRTKKYFGNNYATVCPSVMPLEEGKWKFLAWSQCGPVMTLYEDGEVIYYNRNAPLDISPGGLRFSPGDNHPSTLRNVTVCRGAKSPQEIADMYNNEHPSTKEGISSQFRKLISVGPFRKSKDQPTATYKENISGTFYELIEVENYTDGTKYTKTAVSDCACSVDQLKLARENLEKAQANVNKAKSLMELSNAKEELAKAQAHYTMLERATLRAKYSVRTNPKMLSQ